MGSQALPMQEGSHRLGIVGDKSREGVVRSWHAVLLAALHCTAIGSEFSVAAIAEGLFGTLLAGLFGTFPARTPRIGCQRR